MKKNQKAPTQKNATFVGIVLDSSGSMEFGKSITIDGFNKQLETIQKSASQVDGETKVSLISFNTTFEELAVNQTPEKIKRLSNENYRPGGGTALYDGIGRCLTLIESQKEMKQKDSAALVLIFTDGEENSSTQFNGKDLGKRIRDLEETGQWTFTLIGPKDQVLNLSEILNLKKGNVLGIDVSHLGQRVMASGAMAGGTSAYFTTRSMGQTSVNTFYEDAPKTNKGLMEEPLGGNGLMEEDEEQKQSTGWSQKTTKKQHLKL